MSLDKKGDKDTTKKLGSNEKEILKAKPVNTEAPVEDEVCTIPPELQKIIDMINRIIGKNTVISGHICKFTQVPILKIISEKWCEVARFLHDDNRLAFKYMRNYAGADQLEYFQVIVHLASLSQGNREVKYKDIGILTHVNHESPSLPSLAPYWPAANWNEREIYDLLGIRFQNHPDLRRIMLSDEWVGYPLRKDYEPLDQGV